MKVLLTIERLMWALGVIGTVIFLSLRIHGTLSSRAALASFEAVGSVPPEGGDHDVGKASLQQSKAVDFSLWSPKRILGYQQTLTQDLSLPLAVLRIPKIHLEVPVFEGTDEWTLNRGVGRIMGTSKPGEPGNIGIAGHRDGFFRGLRDVGIGDHVELVMPERTEKFVVDHIKIVPPEDVTVLTDRGSPSLTLVTCYPFYFVGDAPRRFILQCSLE